MAEDVPFLLKFRPGTQRDGTQFDTDRYLDAQWCRWRLGQPRKMGGYTQITDQLNGLPRRVHCFYENGNIIAHIGTISGIQQVVFGPTGNLVSVADRTPLNFPVGANVGYTMDAIFDTTSNATQLVVHAVPDTADVSSSLTSVPYIGIIDSVSKLNQFSNPGSLVGGAVWTQPNIAGGIVCVQPFVFDFDANGFVGWSAPNLPLYLGVVGGSTGAGQARISSQKVIAGMALRGGGTQSPAALFWTMSEVISAVYVGSPAWFSFNTVSPSSSILGSDVVVEYDGLYFWAGVDRFMVFNGTVAEVPNPQNQDWFFDNLTPGYQASTYAFKVPRFGEIWWCACMFGSVVPNYAIIYNLRENAWYDTVLPDGGRSAAFFAQGSKNPIMCGVQTGSRGYSLWMHETGVDKNTNGTLSAVRSYFETSWFGGIKNDPPTDQGLSFGQFEADINQTGDLIFYLLTAANASSPVVQTDSLLLREVAAIPQEQWTSITEKQPNRLTRLHIESNVIGGNYVCGRNIGHGAVGGGRKFS